MKMSKSDAGKLGAEISKKFSALRKQKNIELYLNNPKVCKNCKTQLGYEHRFKSFCNSSCSASFNNVSRVTAKTQKGCLFCGTTIGIRGKYCSNKCQHEHQYQTRVDGWLKNNTKPGFGVIRRYLTETFGYKCSECNISDYNKKPITLEIEHKDGNSENYLLSNLCFLCPNCHSQTPTYKAKNRGNGRHSRRKRYREGKSY